MRISSPDVARSETERPAWTDAWLRPSGLPDSIWHAPELRAFIGEKIRDGKVPEWPTPAVPPVAEHKDLPHWMATSRDWMVERGPL